MYLGGMSGATSIRGGAILATLGLAICGHTTTFINFNNQVNADITTLSGGSGYPQNGGFVTISGITHQLALTSTNRTGSMFFGGSTKIVPVNLFGIRDVYTIINSAQGVFGQLNGQIEVVGSGGLSQIFTLTQGTNIRDHFNGNFNNVATGLNGTQSYASGVRFDQQRLTLNSAFHTATLIEIRFTGQNNGGANGNPMLQSLTVVPEPATLLVIGTGIAALIRRRRS